jgi:hypothetical protein
MSEHTAARDAFAEFLAETIRKAAKGGSTVLRRDNEIVVRTKTVTFTVMVSIRRKSNREPAP